MIDPENHNPKNLESSKKAVLTSSYLVADGLFSKGTSPVRSPRKSVAPPPDSKFGCKKLDFSNPAALPPPSTLALTTMLASVQTARKITQKKEPQPEMVTPKEGPKPREVLRMPRGIWGLIPWARRHKIAQSLMLTLQKLKMCHLKLKDLENESLFPRESYFLPNSKRFFRFVAENNLDRVLQMLVDQPGLVYQTDSVPSSVFSNRSCLGRPSRPLQTG
jgi:hypothetical protein